MELLTLTDLRKLAIHVRCRTESVPSARENFVKRLNQVISRAPKIRFWK